MPRARATVDHEPLGGRIQHMVDKSGDGTELTLQRADERMLSYVETLLEENGLPSQDVRSTSASFYVGYVGDDPIGVGGIERDGPDGLLRSVVIEASAREEGFGTALCEALETAARADGDETLYLLTTTATEFFAARGYVVIDRTAVPASIHQTTEFDELCPTTATCMTKSLER